MLTLQLKVSWVYNHGTGSWGFASVTGRLEDYLSTGSGYERLSQVERSDISFTNMQRKEQSWSPIIFEQRCLQYAMQC